MGVIKKGVSFSAGEQLTADKLNDLVDLAEFTAVDTTDNSSINLSANGKLQVKDSGITPSKLSTGHPGWEPNGILTSGNGDSSATFSGDIRVNGSNKRLIFGEDGGGVSVIDGAGGVIELHADIGNNSTNSKIVLKADGSTSLEVLSTCIFIASGSAPTGEPVDGAYLFYDEAEGKLKFKKPNGGGIETITSS